MVLEVFYFLAGFDLTKTLLKRETYQNATGVKRKVKTIDASIPPMITAPIACFAGFIELSCGRTPKTMANDVMIIALNFTEAPSQSASFTGTPSRS